MRCILECPTPSPFTDRNTLNLPFFWCLPQLAPPPCESSPLPNHVSLRTLPHAVTSSSPPTPAWIAVTHFHQIEPQRDGLRFRQTRFAAHPIGSWAFEHVWLTADIARVERSNMSHPSTESPLSPFDPLPRKCAILRASTDP